MGQNSTHCPGLVGSEKLFWRPDKVALRAGGANICSSHRVSRKSHNLFGEGPVALAGGHNNGLIYTFGDIRNYWSSAVMWTRLVV